jgi:ElaB/YqjD/DUF883 family membrane-anchored ribosome-binding protein
MAESEDLHTQEEEMADEPISDGVAAARERFQRLSDDVQGQARKVGEEVRRGAERASREFRRGAERAKEAYDDMTHRARQTYRKVQTKASDVTHEVNRFVRDNPGKSIAIAAAVGFLIGLLVRRRSDED